MDTTGSPTRSSQNIRTYESFCAQFCSQVEKYVAGGYSQNKEKYVQQITKILSQLSEEHRWVTFLELFFC